MQTWGISTLGPRLYTKRGLESLFWAQLTLKTTRRTRRTARARASTTRTSWRKSVGKAQTRWVPLLWRFTAHLRQPGRHSATRTLPSLVASVAIGATRDWQDSGTCAGRSQAVQLIRPDGESGDLDMDVEQLQVRDIGCYPSTKAVTETLFAHWTPILALALVHLIRAMRTGGRRLDFLGLTGTMLSDGAASMIAGALNTLRDPASGGRDSWDPAGCSGRTCPTPAPDSWRARWCQSSPQPGQRAGASNLLPDSCWHCLTVSFVWRRMQQDLILSWHGQQTRTGLCIERCVGFIRACPAQKCERACVRRRVDDVRV